MSKIVLSTKINAMFLATVLLVGTFALMSPSFINNAQAEPGYDKPQQHPSYKPGYNYKSKDTIGIKKVNCNNVNLNVNDASVNVGRPPIGDFTTLDTSSSETADQEGITTANNFANGERPNNVFKKDKDGFVFVCINNNNNAGREDGDEIEECETCFRTILTEDELAGIIGDFELEEIDSLREICNFIDTNFQTEEGRVLISTVLFTSFNNAEVSSSKFFALIECLEDIYNVVFPT